MHNQSSTDVDETSIRYTHTRWNVAAAESALVLVDLWSTHIIASHLKRCSEVIESRIAPLLAAVRSAEITIIHAPGPGVVRHYSDHPGYMAVESPAQHPEADWPPKEFRERSGDCAEFAHPFLDKSTDKIAQKLYHARRIPKPAEPGPDDYLVASGQQLHELLRDLKIVHLFYAGFATNDCVLFKDYGVRAMAQRGYNVMFLRDCTAGIEDARTLHRRENTEAATRYIELYNCSLTSSDLIAALAE
jgi:nicotinamidase-related amidase